MQCGLEVADGLLAAARIQQGPAQLMVRLRVVRLRLEHLTKQCNGLRVVASQGAEALVIRAGEAPTLRRAGEPLKLSMPSYRGTVGIERRPSAMIM